MSRRYDKTTRAFYLNSYAKAQQSAPQTEGTLFSMKPSDVPYGNRRPVKFGCWRLPAHEVAAARRLDAEIGQVAQVPLDQVPKMQFLQVPHIQDIFEQSRALDERPDATSKATTESELSDCTALTRTSDRMQAKMALLDTLFTDVLLAYRSRAVLEFVRQERTWVDALAVCSAGVWKHSDPSRRKLFGRSLESLEDICISKCPRGDGGAFLCCHREILRNGVRVGMNAVLRGFLRASKQPGHYWRISMKLFSQLDSVKRIQAQGPQKYAVPEGKGEKRAETLALLLHNLGTRNSGSVFQVMDFIDDHFPEMARRPVIWAAYFSTHACSWQDCVRIYNTNFVHKRIEPDTSVFNALIQRCVDAKSLDVAKALHVAMRSRGVPESIANDDGPRPET